MYWPVQSRHLDADSLVFAIRDVLLQMNINIANYRGQCYDGTSNMSGAHKGVAKLKKRVMPFTCIAMTMH